MNFRTRSYSATGHGSVVARWPIWPSSCTHSAFALTKALYTLIAPRLLQAATPPFQVGGLDAILLLQHAAHPDVGGHLVLRHADGPALEVGRRLDAAVGADVDAGVAEQPRHKGRHRDIMRRAA